MNINVPNEPGQTFCGRLSTDIPVPRARGEHFTRIGELFSKRLWPLVLTIPLYQTCRAAHKLFSTRSFWQRALENERLIHPIARVSHDDLSRHDTRSLRGIAKHTLKLKKHWSMPTLHVKDGPNRNFDLVDFSASGPNVDVLFHIVPATSLYLLHSTSRGTLEVWDTSLKRLVTQVPFKKVVVEDLSPADDSPGEFSMAFLTSDPVDM